MIMGTGQGWDGGGWGGRGGNPDRSGLMTPNGLAASLGAAASP